MYVDVEYLPDTATVYVFPSRKLLTVAQQAVFRKELREFLKDWRAHDESLSAGLYIDDYRVVLFIDESVARPSGCALDEWNHKLSELAREAKVECPYYHQVLCPEGETYRLFTQEEALAAWKEGNLNKETLIVQPQPKTKGNFFSSKGRVALGESWLAKLYTAVLCLGMLVGCSSRWRAERHFSSSEYQPAVRIYKKLLREDPNQSELHYKLAESLRKINRLYEALPYYKQSITQYPEALPYYVESLKTHQAYEEAKTVLREVLQGSQIDEELRNKLQDQLKQLKALDVLQKHPSYYQVDPLDGLNTSAVEYAPVYRRPWLYFVSTRERKKIHTSTGEPYSLLFRVKMDKQLRPLLGTIEMLPEVINLARANTGSMSFYPNGRTMIFARGNVARETDKNLRQTNLYYSKLRRSGWTHPKLMSASSTEAWDSSPSLSLDGLRLYFSSTREGGYGGADIYVANRSRRGRWQKPKRLGPEVNTSGNELFPHLGADDRLYFASNGHVGFGGLDLFVVDTVGDELKARNLGASINSSSDDFALFSVDAHQGLFSSSREGNDDLYTYINHDPSLKVISLHLQLAVQGEGKGVISDVLVELIENKGTILSESYSNSKGEVRFPVQTEEDYFVKVEREGYFTKRVSFSTRGISPNKDTLRTNYLEHTFYLEVLMSPIVLQRAIVLEDIYYDLDKAHIRSDARFSLEKLLQLMQDNPNITIELSSHTDSRADSDYNLNLSQRRAEAVVNYLIEKGVKKDRLRARGYGETKLRVANARTEEEHQANRRTEFKVLSYNRAASGRG